MTDGSCKVCRKCNELLPLTAFSPQADAKDGRHSRCKPCRASSELARKRSLGVSPQKKPIIGDGCKTCLDCGVMKPLEEFGPYDRGRCGRHPYCKPCRNARFHNPERSRRHTAAYRKRHAERWRSLHRINQFNRMSMIDAVDDGTVTDDFLQEVYATEVCQYCNHRIPEDSRTADHIIPLTKGGIHSASNIMMACHSCNSAKAAKTPAEYAQLVLDRAVAEMRLDQDR